MLYPQDLLMKYQMRVLKKMKQVFMKQMILNLTKIIQLNLMNEYRSPGWDRYKKNKLLKWKK